MEINNIGVINIRPMTEDEKHEYFEGIQEYMDKDIFCIELENNTIIYPKDNCIKCMLESNCLLNLTINYYESTKHSRSKNGKERKESDSNSGLFLS